MVELWSIYGVQDIIIVVGVQGMVKKVNEEGEDPRQPTQGEREHQHNQVSFRIDWVEIWDPVLEKLLLEQFENPSYSCRSINTRVCSITCNR